LPEWTAGRILSGTAEPRTDAGSLGRRVGAALVPPLVALVVAWATIAVRSPYRGWRLLDPSSYGRWDTGHYLHIARSGYAAVWHCGASHLPGNLPPGNYLCGTIGWFPGYPFAMRGLSTVTGLPLMTAGLILAWTCWYLVLVLMWRLLAGARSPRTRWLCLLIAAFFPGQIYFAALFPISMCIAGILTCLYVTLRRPNLAWLGFAAGFVAAYSYLTAIVLAPALLITSLLVLRGRRRLQVILPAAGAAAGFAAVLLTMQLWVGIWDAYFISARKYNVGAHMPLDSLIARLRPLWTPVPSDQHVRTAAAAQTLLTLGLVGLVCVVTVVGAVRGRAWTAPIASPISAFDLTFLLMTVGVWLVPYIAGGSASAYRSEAFVVVGVPLLRRLPARLLVVPLGAAVYVAWHMVPYFFNGQLH
jgi:hypothetical protein